MATAAPIIVVGHKNPDNDFAPWKVTDAFAPGASTHQGMVYAIQHPQTGKMIYPSLGRCWALGQDKMLEIMAGWCPYRLQNIDDTEERARICGVPNDEVRADVQALVLAQSLEESRALAKAVYERGQWPVYYFNSKGKGGIARKTYLTNVDGRLPTNYWPYSEVGHTDEAKKELKAIFDGRTPFDTPKPTRLIERVLQIAAGDDAIVLDSFAGSGTTAHAVMNLNRTDGGARRCILVEMMDYADGITAERVRRVIAGYGKGKGVVGGVDSGFSYYELGPSLFQHDETLNPSTTRSDLARYVWATETRKPYEDLTSEHPYLLGEHAQAVYYLAYEPGEETTLTYDLLRELPRKGSPTVIYADRCAIAPERLDEMGIVFKRVPDQIARI